MLCFKEGLFVLHTKDLIRDEYHTGNPVLDLSHLFVRKFVLEV